MRQDYRLGPHDAVASTNAGICSVHVGAHSCLQELEDAKESQARTYLVKEYIQTHKVENVKKFYGLRQTILADVWAAYWCGTLGTHPGSGTGSQTLEGLHRLWQSVLTKSTRQRRPCSPSTGLRICRTTTPQARHYGPGLPSSVAMPCTGSVRIRPQNAGSIEIAAIITCSNAKERSSGLCVVKLQTRRPLRTAQASVQPRTARRLVDMLYMSEAETRQLFLDAEILIRTESGGYRISISELELLFGAHAVVMEVLPQNLPCSRMQEQARVHMWHPLYSGPNACTFISWQACRVKWTWVTFLRSGSQGAQKQTLPRRKRACVRAQVPRSASVASGHRKVSVFACEIRTMFQSQRPRTAARCRHTHASSRLALCQRGFANDERPPQEARRSGLPRTTSTTASRPARAQETATSTASTPRAAPVRPQRQAGLGGLAAHQDASSPCLLGLKPFQGTMARMLPPLSGGIQGGRHNPSA